MYDNKRRKIVEQLAQIYKCLANAEEYVAKNVNVESSSFLHFGDWWGNSGHPKWMKNFMIPATLKARASKEKVLESLANKAKEKSVSMRRRATRDDGCC